MKIIHCFRTPVAGLFRHVLDLVPEQAKAGHEIGILCDISTGGEQAIEKLDSISEYCSLGIHRINISRHPSPLDVKMLWEAKTILKPLYPDILHSHGAKGGLIARSINRSIGAKAVYTPHAGVLNYDFKTPIGIASLLVEKILLRTSDGMIFVCDYERESFHRKVGNKNIPFIVNYNGLKETDFTPIQTKANATDLIFLGEIRKAKGVIHLLEALKILQPMVPATATIVGDGADMEKMKNLCTELGLDAQVTFTGALPAQEALTLGRIFVLPAIFESFPYVLLEAAAKALPIVSTDVGGIKELLTDTNLVPPANASALADAIKNALDTEKQCISQANLYRDRVRSTYRTETMAENTLSFYNSIM